MKTLLENLRIPRGENDTHPASILIEDGKVTAVLAAGDRPRASRVEDMGNGLLLPAAIDGHVHFDDPGYTEREDFLSGTRSAAAGGVGLVVDMPCTSVPEVTTLDRMKKKLNIISAKAIIDFMLWGGISGQCLEQPDWREQAGALVEAGIAGFKCYLISGMESFRALDLPQLAELLSWAQDIPVGLHAEDPETIHAARSGLGPADSPGAYADSRPASCEVKAVVNLIELCRKTRARMHIVHLASGAALQLITRAREAGLPISAETCPHYLLFERRDLENLGALLKTAPVVKSGADREALWRGLASGELLYVASDHAAAKWPEEKNSGSIWTDYGGIPGVELLLPSLYSEGYRSGRISLSRLVEISSTAAAEFFGISDRKGKIAPGFDADFALIDEKSHWIVRAEELHNKNRYTPLEGRRLEGRVMQTWLRGRCVFRRLKYGREEFGPPGAGRWIRREKQ